MGLTLKFLMIKKHKRIFNFLKKAAFTNKVHARNFCIKTRFIKNYIIQIFKKINSS